MMDNFPEQVAWRTLNLLIERKALIQPQGVAFYVWERQGRTVVAFDPSAIIIEKVDQGFAHALSTRLHGRRVVRTNSRGLFLQVGQDIPEAPKALDVYPLDYSQQLTPWHMPIGVTSKGPLWVSLTDGDSFLVGGSRGNGKTGLAHGMIQALLRGGKTIVYAWDGKNGLEFGRYIGEENFHYIANPQKGLEELSHVLAERFAALRESGFPNILLHNGAGRDFIPPIAFVVDEIAELEEDEKETINKLVKLYRAAGLHPILCTNNPTQAAVLAKTNLTTRICFRVPSWNDSMVVLAMKGAETLPQTLDKQPGRGMIIWRGRLTEFMAFHVTWPDFSEYALKVLAELHLPTGPSVDPNSIEALAESIREQWRPGLSKRKVAELLGKPYGGSWATKIDQIVACLTATTTTERPLGNVLGLEME
jgi:hypothetical protein